MLVCTPRRFGKTTSVAMFCAALLYCVPDMWISCFSTGQRASSSLLDLVAKFVCTREDGEGRILKKNQEQLFLKGNNPSDVRRMFSYPSSVAGLKGVGGRVRPSQESHYRLQFPIAHLTHSTNVEQNMLHIRYT